MSKPTYEELVALVRRAQQAASHRWFVSDGEDEDNDDEMIELDRDAQDLLDKLGDQTGTQE